MNKKTKKKSLYFIFLLSAGAVFFYLLNTVFVLQDIELEVQQEAEWDSDKMHLLLQSKLKTFIGKKIWQVSFKDVISVLQQESRVGDIHILRLLPQRLFIQVKPRKSTLVFFNSKKGTIHPLSTEANILGPFSNQNIPDLPILRGRIFLKKRHLREKAIEFVNKLPSDGFFSQKEISEIQYSVKDKSFLFFLSSNGYPIKVGQDPLQINHKRLESVLRYLDQKDIQWRVIDARFSQKIVVSTTKAI